MSLERYLRLQMPTAVLFSGLAFLISDKIDIGCFFVIIGFACLCLFRKEQRELTELADTDEIKPKTQEMS